MSYPLSFPQLLIHGLRNSPLRTVGAMPALVATGAGAAFKQSRPNLLLLRRLLQWLWRVAKRGLVLSAIIAVLARLLGGRGSTIQGRLLAPLLSRVGRWGVNKLFGWGVLVRARGPQFNQLPDEPEHIIHNATQGEPRSNAQGGETMLRKYTRRGTRGRGRVLIGQRLMIWSSLHDLAVVHRMDPTYRAHDPAARADLLRTLVGRAKREGYTVHFADGRQIDYEAGARETQLLAMVCRDAVAEDGELADDIREYNKAELKLSYRNYWERYGFVVENRIGMSLWSWLKMQWGYVMLGLGLAAPLPPRE